MHGHASDQISFPVLVKLRFLYTPENATESQRLWFLNSQHRYNHQKPTVMDPRTRPTAVKIHRDTSLAQTVCQRLHDRLSTVLFMKSPEAPDVSIWVDNTINVNIITTAVCVYEWLSAYGTSAFAVLKEPAGKHKQDGIVVKLTRVGAITGDVQVQFVGDKSMACGILQLLLVKNSKGSAFKAVTVVDRYTALAAPSMRGSTRFHCSGHPYGLVPGYLLAMTSSDMDELMFYCEQVGKDAALSDSMGEKAKFNSPRKMQHTEVRGIPTVALSLPSKNLPNRGKAKSDGPKMDCKLIEFTREEITYLIGKKGSKITEIRKSTGCNIKVVPIQTGIPGIDGVKKPRNNKMSQFLRLTGTPNQLRSTLKKIEAEIYQFRSSGDQSY